MKKLVAVLMLASLLIACSEKKQEVTSGPIVVRRYSPAIKDSFSVFIQLPDEYKKAPNAKYPVVYVLDANLYFDVMGVIFKKYSEVGLLSPAILVGIGYKDFKTMDSLRDRDYTFPEALPGVEMRSSGKADNFLDFIKNDLIPYVDGNYPASVNSRVLMGHSLGGYFTLYALHESLMRKESPFTSYIAASPSLDYNHYYLLNEFEALEAEAVKPTKAYITYGGLEELEEADERDSAALNIDQQISWITGTLKRAGNVHCRGDIYSNLGHMDMPLPSFIRGLQWALDLTE